MSLVEDAQNHVIAARQPLDAIAASVAEAHSVTDDLVRGSQAAGYTEKTATATEIRDALGDLHGVLTDSASTLDDVHAKLETLKRLLAASNSSGTRSPAQVPHADEPRRAHVPAGKVAEFGERLPAHRQGEPTVGFAIWPDGSAVPIQSSTGRARQYREGLKLPNRSVVPQHAEGQATWRMRKDSLSELSIVINNPPCSGMPQTCEETLREHIPRGRRLSVYVKDAEGQTDYYRTYRGTGEAVDESYSWGVE